MHYKNGREAKQGDLAVCLTPGEARAGIVYSIITDSGEYNARMAPIDTENPWVQLSGCLHVDDIVAKFESPGEQIIRDVSPQPKPAETTAMEDSASTTPILSSLRKRMQALQENLVTIETAREKLQNMYPGRVAFARADDAKFFLELTSGIGANVLDLRNDLTELLKSLEQSGVV